jgi:hypothetical protein
VGQQLAAGRQLTIQKPRRLSCPAV